uniref:Uncharacterized protein n=1 Tax=Anopheles coluzzii TaxID=1518534 RepID=A0A8W7PPI5_ANOCL
MFPVEDACGDATADCSYSTPRFPASLSSSPPPPPPPPVSIGCVVACFAPLDPPGGDSAGVAAGGTGSGGGGTGRCDSISSSSARSNLRFFGCCRGVAFWVTGFSDAADDAAATVHRGHKNGLDAGME